jgi:hypothetical protein
MLVCAVTSTATALNRWLVAYRKLAIREAEVVEVTPEPAELPVPVPARITALSSPDLHKIRPLEQH